MKNKTITIRLLAVLSALILVLAGMPMNVFAAKTITITLKVKSGQDIVTAFNNATIKAKDDKKGNTYKIVVPKGSYKAKNQLKIWSNTTLILDGVTIKHTSGSTTMFRLGHKNDWDRANKGKGYPGYSGYKNITIQGGVLDGGGYSQAIIRFGHTTNVKLQGVTFKNVKNNHHVEIGGCMDFLISGCVFSDFSGSWGSKRNYEALQLEALAGDHFSAYNPNKDETPNQNITIENCQFNNLQRALGTHTGIANSYFNNIVIRNNIFTNITGYAIVATNYMNSVISGNTMTDCGAGIYFRTMDPSHNNFYASKINSNARPDAVNLNCSISGNSISIKTGHKAKYKNRAYGIQLYGENLSSKRGRAPKGDFRTSGVTVSGNSVYLAVTGYPIWLNGATGNTVTGNSVNLNAQAKSAGSDCDGIRLDYSSYNTISYNTVTNSTSTALANSMCGMTISNSAGCKIIGNTITGAKLDGVKLYQSGSCKIRNNSMSGSARDGLCVSTLSNASISGNSVKNCARHGINVNVCSNVKLAKNNIKNCGSNGINALAQQITKDKGNTIFVKGKARSWI